MQDNIQSDGAEKQLIEQLSKAGFDKTQLSETSRKIALFQKAGVKVNDWHIAGVPPFERLFLSGQSPLDKVSGLQLILTEKTLKDFRIWKVGVPPVQSLINIQVQFDHNQLVK